MLLLQNNDPQSPIMQEYAGKPVTIGQEDQQLDDLPNKGWTSDWCSVEMDPKSPLATNVTFRHSISFPKQSDI